MIEAFVRERINARDGRDGGASIAGDSQVTPRFPPWMFAAGFQTCLGVASAGHLTSDGESAARLHCCSRGESA